VVGRARRGRDAAPGQGPDLQAAIALANQRIYAAGLLQSSDEVTQRGTMGTTVVALACDVAARRAQWAHVGDSRLYRARAGALALLTADHTLFGEPYWDAATVPVDLPHTNRLLRAVGITPEVQVTVRSDPLAGGDLFLLCSDGISGMVAPEELGAMLRGAAPLQTIATALIERALGAGGKDNASVLLVRVLDA
jgi:protein phosphatase